MMRLLKVLSVAAILTDGVIGEEAGDGVEQIISTSTPPSSTTAAPPQITSSDETLAPEEYDGEGGDVFAQSRRFHGKLHDDSSLSTSTGAIISIGGACPPGYILSDNQCLLFGPAGLSCPEGYTEEESGFPGVTSAVVTGNRTCVLYKPDVLPSFECANGEVNGLSCLIYNDVAPRSTGCPEGYELTTIGCISLTRIPFGGPFCADGQKLVDGKCFTVEEFAPTRTCPNEGSQLGNDGVTCVVRTRSGSPIDGCPLGFRKEGGKCRNAETASPQLRCADGGTLKGGECITSQSTPAIAKCSEGFSLDGTQCIGLADKAPQFVCPDGFEAVSDTECETLTDAPPEAECSVYNSFYDAATEQCIAVKQAVPPTLTCEEGAEDRDGQCFVVEIAAAEASCDQEGYRLTPGVLGVPTCQQCVATENSPPLLPLPKLWQKHHGGHGHHGGHRAYKHAEEEQTQGNTPSSTSQIIEATPTLPSTNLRALQDDETEEHQADDENESKTGEGADAISAIESSEGKASLEKVDVAAPPPKAAATTYRRHHHGGDKSHHGDGATDTPLGGDGNFFTCSSIAVSFTCSDGFNLIVDDASGESACESLTEASGTLTCPSGFDLSPDESTCEDLDFSAPSFSCQSGFDQTDDGRCVKKDRAPKSATCASGSPQGNPPQCLNVEITIPATLSCPNGSTLVGQECTSTKSTAASIGCPHGYDIDADGNGCTSNEIRPTQKQCTGEGRILEGGECYTYPGTPGVLTCPEGVDLVNGSCQRLSFVAQAGRCPTGFFEFSEECIKDGSAPLVIKCPEVAQQSNGKCQTVTEVASVVKCPEDLVPVDIFNGTAKGCFKLAAPSIACPEGQSLSVGEKCLKDAIAPSIIGTSTSTSSWSHHTHTKKAKHPKKASHNHDKDKDHQK